MVTEYIDENLQTEEHWFDKGHYQQPVTTGEHLVSRFLLPVLSYIAMFVGTGLVGGAIVHSGETSTIPRNAVLAAIGITIFMLGSTFFEVVVLRHKLTRDTVARFLFFSMLLSISIGMMSGGIQHFTDFPKFAPKIIPLGLILAIFAFGLKHRVELHGNSCVVVAMAALALGAGTFGITSTVAKPYLENPAASHHGSTAAEETRHNETPTESDAETASHNETTATNAKEEAQHTETTTASQTATTTNTHADDGHTSHLDHSHCLE